MNSNLQIQDEIKFFTSLTQYLININILKSNQKDKFQQTCRPIHPLLLYKQICRRGGYQAVTNRNLWQEVSSQLFYYQNVNRLKIFYYEYLLPYEQKYYFGKQNEDDLPNMIYGQPRKIVKTEQSQNQPQQGQVQLDQQNMNTQQVNNMMRKVSAKQQPSKNLQEEIKKKFQEQEKIRKIFYLNKNKLNQTKAETKKIILGLQPFMDRKDVIYSLNMLLIYSANSSSSFLFQNNEKIFNSLSNFSHSIYPPKHEQNLQDLRMITLIFRNFTLNPINLKFILGTTIFELFVRIFNQGVDKESSKNIIDIMSGLVKVGWDCKRIMMNLNNALLQSQNEIVNCSIQLLRGLVDQRQENLLNIIPENITILNRVLLNKQISTDIKQQVFEILSFVTDSSPQARQLISKNYCLIGIIVGILQNIHNHQKLTQLAALTLNNISNAMSGKSVIKEFENQLVLIGFSDDSLAGILANILADIATL